MKKESPSKLRIHPWTVRRFAPIVRTLLAWHSHNKRPLVWRGKRPSPYVVLVSEFMLQQTGAAHVDKRLPIFLEQFPDISALASATRPEILRAWHGLGYNRRALHLHAAAQAIVRDHGGRFPREYSELRALPGIGDYTGSAILSFAFRRDVPVVDVNIERVLSRLWKPMKTQEATLPIGDVRELDRAILPTGQSHVWHEALMDFGATICTKRSPKCTGCPLRSVCPSAKFLRNATTATRVDREVKHFGHPRRIWRGRILKLISTQEPITVKSLLKSIGESESGFAEFAADIVRRLQDEGFIRSKKGALWLAD
jgi:A/G-specific adenine glycosylase